MADKQRKKTVEPVSPRVKGLRLEDFAHPAELITEKEGANGPLISFQLQANSLLLCLGYAHLVDLFCNLPARRNVLNEIYHRVKAGSISMEIAAGVPLLLKTHNSHGVMSGLLFNGLAHIERIVREEGNQPQRVRKAVKSTFQTFLPFCYALVLYLRGLGLLTSSRENFECQNLLKEVLYDFRRDLRGEAIDWVLRGLGMRAEFVLQWGDKQMREEFGEETGRLVKVRQQEGRWSLEDGEEARTEREDALRTIEPRDNKP